MKEEIISKNEEQVLREFLALAPMPELSFSYYELLGYFYGIAITPKRIPPNEWVPVIFGEGVPEYEDEEQAQWMLETLLAVLNRHIAAFHNGSLNMPFALENLSEKDIDTVWEWTSGFDEALALRPECWEEKKQGMSEEEKDHLMYSLIVVEGVVHPDEAVDMFDHIPAGDLMEIGVTLSEDETEKAMQVQLYLLQALELAVATIQKHGAKMELIRQERIRSSNVPFALRSSKVEKNQNCPCGSGKKYQDCCGRSTNAQSSSFSENKGGTGAKVIQGNFPQHGKLPKNKKPQRFSGKGYQLEVSLSFVEPAVMRHIQVPDSITLADLHMTIQLCMGWQDMHMHQFQAGIKFYGPPMADDYRDNPILDESRFPLSGLEKELLQGIVYTYDFGDNWEHVVMLEKLIPAAEAKPYPVLVGGSRACPPEDIGGAPGYQYFLEALTDPDNEEYQELVTMPGLQGYDPEEFDMVTINTLLRNYYDTKK